MKWQGRRMSSNIEDRRIPRQQINRIGKNDLRPRIQGPRVQTPKYKLPPIPTRNPRRGRSN